MTIFDQVKQILKKAGSEVTPWFHDNQKFHINKPKNNIELNMRGFSHIPAEKMHYKWI